MSDQIPAGWSRKTIGDLADVVSGGTPARDVPAFWEQGTIPWVTPTDITGADGRYLNESTEKISSLGLASSGANMLPTGTVLMTSRATVGEAKIAAVPCCTNQGFKSLIPKRDVDSLFLFYLTQLHKEGIKAFGSGSTFLEVGKADILRFSVTVPGYTQQKAISRILDSVDSAIEQTEALIAKYQQIKAGLMQSFFMSPDVMARWTPMTLNDLFENIIDYRGKTPEKTASGIPLITAKNVRVGYIDPEPREFIAENQYSTWMTRGIPRKGDILFTTEAPLGNVAEIPTTEKVAFAQRVIILQSKDAFIPAFVKHLLMSPLVQDSFLRNASGSTALGIKQSTFRRISVLATEDRDEQQTIADKLNSVDAFLRTELLSLEKQKRLKNGLVAALLSGFSA